jgi:beta-lactam-binding protein with PASTA domain
MSCDPTFGNVVLLLPFDGTNGQITTTDASSFANPVTINNGALSTASPQFGTAAFQTTGANLYLSYAVGVPFAHGSPLDIFAANGWTIEGWFNLSATGGNGAQLVDYGGSETGSVTSDLVISAGTDGTTVTVSAYDYAAFGTGATINAASTTGAAPGTWHHFALVNNAGTTTIYLDGVAGSSYGNWTPSHYGVAGTTNVIIGSFSRFSGGTTPAQIDEVRVSNIAQYTTNFTPPVAAFPTLACSQPIPNLVGLLTGVADAAIIAGHFTVGTTTAVPSGLPAGTVIDQTPAYPGTGTVGDPISYDYSAGVLVPDLTNTSVGIVAPMLLADAGLVLGTVTYVPSVLIIAGNIISQSPIGGSFVSAGSAVNVFVSTGRGPVVVPFIVEDTQTDAMTAITDIGLVVGAISVRESLTIPAGEVIAQNPQGGTPVASGTLVSFTLSSGPPVPGPAFDWTTTVISQYANSPSLLLLCQSIADNLDQTVNFANFYAFVWNVYTAQGFGLDIWGRIVNVSRYLQIPTGALYVGFQDGTGGAPDPDPGGSYDVQPFSASGTWYTPQSATQTYELEDEPYRQLILAKALANISRSTVPVFNQILQRLFPGRGNPYVVNNGAMNFKYVFDFVLTPIELAILNQSGVLPVPPGVSFTIIEP